MIDQILLAPGLNNVTRVMKNTTQSDSENTFLLFYLTNELLTTVDLPFYWFI